MAAMMAVAGTATVSRGDEIIERVLAVVAGDVITLADVAAARDLGFVPRAEGDPIGEALDRLIDRALMLAEVDRYVPPEPPADAIDREVQNVRVRFSDAEAFAAALARVGMDERYLRETLRQNLRIQAYIDQRFTIPPPSDEELGAYYRAHPEAFAVNGQVAAFETVRNAVVAAAVAERRQALVNTWMAGLRRRAEILNLYLTSK
jgi:hypothetical protein